MYFKKNEHVYILRSDIHSYNTRNNNKHQIPYTRLNKYKHSYMVNAVTIFNKLPSDVRQLNINYFKDRIVPWLKKNPFYSLDEYINMNDLIVSLYLYLFYF